MRAVRSAAQGVLPLPRGRRARSANLALIRPMRPLATLCSPRVPSLGTLAHALSGASMAHVAALAYPFLLREVVLGHVPGPRPTRVPMIAPHGLVVMSMLRLRACPALAAAHDDDIGIRSSEDGDHP